MNNEDTPTITEESAPPKPSRKQASRKADPTELTMNHNEEACCSFTGRTAKQSSEKVLFREGPFLVCSEAIDVLTNQLAKHRAQKRGE